MTVAVSRTKAEQALTQQFEAVASRLPGDAAIAQARKSAIGTFAALGLPHRRIEEWKYTDLRNALKEALPPAIAGDVAASRQEIDAALEGAGRARRLSPRVRRRPVSGRAFRCSRRQGPGGRSARLRALPKSEGLVQTSSPGQEAVVALNTAFMTDGALVRVADGAQLDKPLLLVFARAGRQPRLITTRNIVRIGAGARATVIEAHVTLPSAAPGQANTLSEVMLGDGARAGAPQGHAGRCWHYASRQLDDRRSARMRPIARSS